MILLAECKELPNAIPLTKKRKPIYYTKHSKIPKKYSNNRFDEKGRLIDQFGNPIIKNQKVVNRPRVVRLNFNLFWSGTIHRSVRSKIKSHLTDYFSKFINCQIKEFPVFIHFESYTSSQSDVDNGSFIYIKAFFDTLIKLKIIPDDTTRYIAGYSWTHKPTNENKLVVYYKKIPDV